MNCEIHVRLNRLNMLRLLFMLLLLLLLLLLQEQQLLLLLLLLYLEGQEDTETSLGSDDGRHEL